MRLELNDGYIIKTLDQYNLVLCKSVVRTKQDSGETYIDEKVLGYYNSLYTALNSYCKKRVTESEAEGVEEIMKLLLEIKEEVSKVLKE